MSTIFTIFFSKHFVVEFLINSLYSSCQQWQLLQVAKQNRNLIYSNLHSLRSCLKTWCICVQQNKYLVTLHVKTSNFIILTKSTPLMLSILGNFPIPKLSQTQNVFIQPILLIYKCNIVVSVMYNMVSLTFDLEVWNILLMHPFENRL